MGRILGAGRIFGSGLAIQERFDRHGHGGAHDAAQSHGRFQRMVQLLHGLSEFARRVESVELAGEPEYIRSSFVVGLKRLPIRYRFSAGGWSQ